MSEYRADIIQQLGRIPEVSLEYFEKFVLPHTAYLDHIDDIIAILRDDGILAATDDNSGLWWADFPVDPKYSENSEQETFMCMAAIAAAVVKAAQQVLPGYRNPTTAMECTRAHQPAVSDSKECDGSLVPDGYYRLLQSRHPTYVQDARSMMVVDVSMSADLDPDIMTYNMTTLEEYSRNDHTSNKNDNIAKLVENTTEVMHADPTRRFMFGTTIENTQASFWFFSRAIILVSESFNFIKDYTHLIHYILSLTFATEEELGFDLSNTYRTVECLSSFRTNSVATRATRVWKAFQLNDPQYRERALKDVWIPSDAKTELEIQQDISRSIEENEPGISKDYRKHFMNILDCEVVRTSRNDDDDMAVFVRALVESIGDTSHTQCLHKGRKHVRVVFADVGMPLYHVQHHNILFSALRDALKGLYYLFLGHYVHRDISAENILLCNGIAKISDLEYAQRFLFGSKKDPKTGTPRYMAVEVQAATYLLYKPARSFENFGQKLVKRFFHNYIHDIESLFWIGFHVLFSTIPAAYTYAQNATGNASCWTFSFHAVESLPLDYQPAARACFHIRDIISYLYYQVEQQADFLQHEHFHIVYHPAKPQLDLSEAFQAAAKVAYDGETQLLPPINVIIRRPRQLPVKAENDGDCAADPTQYIGEGTQVASKKRRTSVVMEKVTGQACSNEDGPSVQGIHSVGKRRRF
ncbi:uncharacterized protein EV420DRAFT_1769154 [Desarmillaria tabescens]|uniref:Protein kinase domain-containing protein n=1 Tax=Armillaria tabescens TaxID=1929756 RepID=A0AA39MNL4_ARMTA|nr:uncharacterized protein EV420DRAFT_1769154 [Desarmillaria tabescens]KAK0440942.1 hypothetical protein EV420DRAFT_1769154 [Desarmillaria tabescens]